ERAGRNEPVGAGVVELDEQPGARDARDVAVEHGADLLREEMRDQAINRLALSHHGSTLARRDLSPDFAERADILAVRQPVAAELQLADQRAMHDEIRIAADRRGKMRVAAQIEAEVTVILRRIFSLRLAAQYHLMHELLDVAAFDPCQDAVEIGRAERLGFRQRDAKRAQELA